MFCRHKLRTLASTAYLINNKNSVLLLKRTVSVNQRKTSSSLSLKLAKQQLNVVELKHNEM